MISSFIDKYQNSFAVSSDMSECQIQLDNRENETNPFP